MGFIKHNAIIVTGFNDKEFRKVHSKAKKIFKKIFKEEGDLYGDDKFGENIVSNIIKGLANRQASFFIAPDGSKEGWETSNNGNKARSEFLDWMEKKDRGCEFIEILFGGDNHHEKITRSNNHCKKP